MAGRITKSVLLALFVLTLASGTLLAQSGLAIAHTKHTGPIVPAKQPPAALKTIFTNLGPTATDEYNDTSGYYILGPTNSLALSEQAIALPFTPKMSGHVEELQAAVGLISGTNLVDVGLYSDNGGTVGTLLASGRSTKVPADGTCCTLVSVKIALTAVTAGTQYWIVVSTDDTNGPDFTGVWEASNNANIAGNVAMGGWFTFSANWPAGAALGTIP